MTNKKKPMYQVIVDDLKKQIAEGKIRHEDPFPTQIELANIYHTSEITSRRALAELVNEGLIYRKRGKGTFLNAEGAAPEVKGPRESGEEIDTIYFVYYRGLLPIFNHRFFTDLMTGLQEVCEENGVNFHIWELDEQFQLPEGNHIGFVLNPEMPEGEIALDQIKRWKEEGRKLVTVHFYYPNMQIPYVIVDNLTGAYLATEHLLTLGHRRIGIILTGSSTIDMNQEFTLRYQGYKLALSQHRVELDPSLVCIVPGVKETEEMGGEGFERLFGLDNPPTAIFATSDIKAIGAMKAARKHKVDVPKDVSIVGYDDIMLSQFTQPSLTTIAQNTHYVGKRAAQILLFENQDANMRDEIVPKLIIRDSTAEIDDGKE